MGVDTTWGRFPFCPEMSRSVPVCPLLPDLSPQIAGDCDCATVVSAAEKRGLWGRGSLRNLCAELCFVCFLCSEVIFACKSHRNFFQKLPLQCRHFLENPLAKNPKTQLRLWCAKQMVEALNEDGPDFTPLCMAAFAENMEVLEILVEAKADLDKARAR